MRNLPRGKRQLSSKAVVGFYSLSDGNQAAHRWDLREEPLAPPGERADELGAVVDQSAQPVPVNTFMVAMKGFICLAERGVV